MVLNCVDFQVLLPRLSDHVISEDVIHVEFDTNTVPWNGHCKATVSSIPVEMVSRLYGSSVSRKDQG